MTAEPRDAFGITDSGRRCAEQINLHVLARATGRWAAIRLSDGGSDGNAYDTRADAIRLQLHPQQCCYIRIPLMGMPEAEAQSYMDLWRDLYDKGVRLDDTDRDLMVPIRVENLRDRRVR